MDRVDEELELGKESGIRSTYRSTGFKKDGSPNNTVVWTANADDPFVPANGNLSLTEDGKLVSTAKDGQTKSITGELNEVIHSASMLNNGNFVLYNSDSKIIWQSFDYPTDTILAGQSLPLRSELDLLRSEQDLLSSSVSKTNHTIGRFRLTLNRDYYGLSLNRDDDDSSSYWEISFYPYDVEDSFKLNLDHNGHMYVARENDTVSRESYIWMGFFQSHFRNLSCNSRPRWDFSVVLA
ncbi:G-type lectin S-receptor-like serine/threonine-protein kinase LECRK1 isoform X1 [Cinnamomum micranthum f. kanehirae]|uniref:G-type lectin S-receptor-like serine/threonine-protein kinase LECRK1 isoform X1 n=1 Tax=Cinnamomum micranthum f. kanehirae TaxID=337451 RepID=A0A443Q415_9MAGN|nr:G-type lectin S-receptor-like serine/threonine-protein kinase LECRK1 isoform X1 [Cinnamomum micranthum f. kanehirae]